MGSFRRIRLVLINTSPVGPERGREPALRKYIVDSNQIHQRFLSQWVVAQVAPARCTLLAQILEGYHSGWCLRMGHMGPFRGLALEVVVAGGEPGSNAAGH